MLFWGDVIFSSGNDKEDDGAAEFRECIRVLADKVGVLSRHRAELLDRHSKAEATQEQLKKELEVKKESFNTLFLKLQLEKQVSFSISSTMFGYFTCNSFVLLSDNQSLVNLGF